MLPAYAAALSLLVLAAHAVTRSLLARKDRLDKSSAPVAENQNDNHGFATAVKKHVESLGGTTIYSFTVARAASVIILFCLTVASFVRDNSGHAIGQGRNGFEESEKRFWVNGVLGISYVRRIAHRCFRPDRRYSSMHRRLLLQLSLLVGPLRQSYPRISLYSSSSLPPCSSIATFGLS